MKITHEDDGLDLYHIVRFRDGDTVEGHLECRHCHTVSRVTIRLPGIDSWELNGSDSHLARDCAARLTKQYRGTSWYLTDRRLRKDCYGRVISDLRRDGTTLTLQLVTWGEAWWGVGAPAPGPGIIKPSNPVT